MELSWMKYFAEVAKSESMTKAAANLFVSQPALSKTIMLLEKELGTSLFERTGRGVRLTASGKAYYESVRCILQDIDSAAAQIRDMSNHIACEVKIVVAVYSKKVIDIILEFRRMYPDIHIVIESPGDQPTSLKDESFELALVAAPYRTDKYKGIHLYNDEMVIVAPPKLEISSKDHADLFECRDYPFVFPAALGENLDGDLFCDMAKVQEALCIYSGFIPKAVSYTNNIETTTTCLLAYNAVTMMPIGFYKSRYSDQFKAIKIDSPQCERRIYIVWDKRRALSHGAVLLKNYICEKLLEHAENAQI